MSEFLLHGHDAAVPAYHGNDAPTACILEQWIEKCRRLDENALTILAPVLDAPDGLETLRKAIGMSPSLANPGRAFAARMHGPLDDFMEFAFQLHQLAAFLKTDTHSPNDNTILTLDGWSRKRLELAAEAHRDIADAITVWCVDMLARFDSKFSTWLRHKVYQDATSSLHNGPQNERG